MLRLIILSIGTLLMALFFIQMARGSSYAKALSGLEWMEYPFCALFTVGFAWSARGPFKLKGKKAIELKRQAALTQDERYAEFYANIVWAQVITYIHLCLTLTFLLAGLIFDNMAFILAIGVFLTVFMAVYAATQMKNRLSERTQDCDADLPEVVSTMAVLLNSGMVLRDVWQLVGKSSNSTIYQLMRNATNEMNSGLAESDAIYRFGLMSGSLEVKKFTSAMLQSMEKGGEDLAAFMEKQSSELWHQKRQKMLQSGEKAATKLLAPIMLIFAGILVIVLTAAFAGALF